MLTPDDISGDPTKFTMDQKETIDAILNDYGKRDGRYLSDLTHMERPWREARKGLEPLERGSSIIDPNTMVDYYGGLIEAEEPAEPEKTQT